MAEFDNELKGVLFKNTRRREGKQDPQAQGSCTIAGVEFWVDAWTDTIKKGDRQGQAYQSLKFRPKDPDTYQALREGAPVAGAAEDDIPF